MKRIALTIIALTLAAPAWALKRAHTVNVWQDTAAQSWTQKCTIKAIGVSNTTSYWGDLWIVYNDPDAEEVLMRVRYAVGPGFETFTESIDGAYAVNATLSTSGVIVTFSATRYGPLYQTFNTGTGKIDEGGSFNCRAGIIRGSGPNGDANTWKVVHTINVLERVGRWQ